MSVGYYQIDKDTGKAVVLTIWTCQGNTNSWCHLNLYPLLWQPLNTRSNSNTSNKSLSRISSGDYKRTQQEVSAGLLPYLYKLHMVHATNNYSCPNIHTSSIYIP